MPTFLTVELDRLCSGEPTHVAFNDAVLEAIRAGDPQWGARVAAEYFAIYEEVLVCKHGLDRRQALGTIAHTRLIIRMAVDDIASSAQISRVISAVSSESQVSWRVIRDILGRLRLNKGLSLHEVEALIRHDSEIELARFADADICVARDSVAAAARQLGFQGNLGELLRSLYPDSGDGHPQHPPYLQILHYQCVISEFFDHAATYIYEFSPRGIVAKSVFSQYEPALAEAGNPFLNNAKSVDRVDLAWAQSKEMPTNLVSSATALHRILLGMEGMPFPARRELASVIRQWLLRVIRLSSDLLAPVHTNPSQSEIRIVLDSISGSETNTQGVLEQRIVDAVALSLHPEAEGWRAHGLGDSVNASNLSRKKLGDCEFQNVETRTVVAYEAHAGRLTEIYIDEHLRSLAKVLPSRIEEWSRVSDPSEWHLEIRFISHVVLTHSRTLEVGEIPVTLTCLTFGEWLAKVPRNLPSNSTYKNLVLNKLNAAQTPQSVRDTYSGIVN